MNYYDEIKEKLIDNEIYSKVKDYSKNRNDLETYYNVGRLIIEAQNGSVRAKYGDNLIKEYSRKLIIELNDKKYSYRNLMNMRKFYLIFCDEKVNAMRSQLSWSHYRVLLPMKDINEIKYYINIGINNNLSYRELEKRIKLKEFKRLPVETRNKLITNEQLEVKDLIPNPILIKNKNNIDIYNEKKLHTLILENIEIFMNELGSGFCFIGSEYKIKLGDTYNFIDILLFNYEYNSFVVIELKATELKKEHIGQIGIYMNYIDNNLKKITQDKTIGIIICKKDNKFVMEYCSDKRILAREYKLI